MISTDLGRLTQIVLGLQSNAIKFTLKGHVKHLISIEDNYLKFEIEDTGLGVKLED